MRRTGPYANLAATVLFALSVGGCAMFATRETKLQAVKTVGIISAVGDEMYFARIGLTGPNNASQSFPIGSWGLDDLIVQQATAALSGRFQVQSLSYQRTAFAAIKDSPVMPVNLVRGDPFKKLLKTEVTPQGLDAYIVIVKAKSNFGGGARKVEGVGFVSYGTLFASYSEIHVLYEIRMYDGKTFDVIEKMTAPPLENGATVELTGPSRLVDESFSPSAGDPAQNENLHGAITDLIARSLSSTLGYMHLADVRYPEATSQEKPN
jgi:hypothetical protein